MLDRQDPPWPNGWQISPPTPSATRPWSVASQQYLRDFSQVANERDSVQGIVEGMLALHGDRENPHTLWISARGEIAKRS